MSEKITILLLKDYGEFKAGEKVVGKKDDVQSLIDDGTAKVVEPEVQLEKAEIEEAASKVLDEFRAELKTQMSKGPIIEMVEDENDKCPFSTAGEFYQHVREHGTGTTTEKMKAYMSKAPAGQNTLVDSEGGFLIPEEFSTQLMQNVEARSILAPRTTQIPINRTIKLPYVRDDDKSSSWFGGITAAWVSEGGTISSSNIAFKQLRLELNKLAALLYVTDELMDDSAIAVETLINTGAAEVIAKEFDDAIIVGTGVGKPLGILNSPCLVTVAKESGQSAETFTYVNALKMWERVSNMNNAVWLMNRTVLKQFWQFSQVVGDGGAPVTVVNATTKLPATLFGAPIIETPHCKTLGTVGDVILADLSQYITATKAGGQSIKSASSIHVKFTTDEIAFRFTFRGDGKPWWHSAVTPKNGTSTISPFVVLATRSS